MENKFSSKILSLLSLIGIIISLICIFAGLIKSSPMAMYTSVTIAAMGTVCGIIGAHKGNGFAHKMIKIMSIVWLVASAFTVATLWMLAKA